MDLKKSLQDPKVRFALYLVVGAAAGLIAGKLGHHRNPSRTPAEMIAAFERIGLPPRMLIAIALTLIPSVYWEIAARGVTTKKEPGRTRVVHLALTAIGQLLVFLPVPGLRARFMPLLMPVVVAGLILEAGSVALTVWARRVLGRNWSGAIATNVDHELIRTGPYRSIRHPIYTGILGMYLGVTLVSGEVHALIGLALILIAYRRKIRMEESHLREAFGPAYADYAQESWRLIPRVY